MRTFRQQLEKQAMEKKIAQYDQPWRGSALADCFIGET